MPSNYPFDNDYSYTTTQDDFTSSNKHKSWHRREKERPSMLFILIYSNLNILNVSFMIV